MSANGEAAEQVTRILLEGTEVLLRLTGKGAERAAVLVYATLRQQEKTKGAARLSSMLRSGKPLKVYTFEDKDLSKFKDVAKQYGVLYSILKEKDKTGGVFDVLVRADDENKINRIIERFSLTKLDTTSLKVELEKERQERERAKHEDEEMNGIEQEKPEKSRSDRMADELMGVPVKKEVTV
ncbi:MAG: PcfB family protein, partial [Clostridia bacterium]|nr:PcfB family protein [Clostridia bacterium]